ncbi:MAG: 2-C-methyl-D-erythritol 2,4-cyclodiphosphate synthase [bacterium]|nr:2-C-methyl-D-erythritol 2,4-cyclodiphosphate synthase [bacterium]
MSVTQAVFHDSAVIWTVLVAAGEGRRFGAPKQLQPLARRRVIDQAFGTAVAASHGVVVVAAADQVDALREGSDALRAHPTGDPSTTIVVTEGGATRSESVRAGIAATPDDADVIIVHDAARPLASGALFAAVTAAVVEGADGAVPAVAVTDTIRHIDHGPQDRSRLRAVQTPQAFRADLLRRAHAGAGEATDDATLVETAGGKVRLVDGEPDNLKITTPGDLHVAEALLAARSPGQAAGVPLIGIGFDVHRFSDDPQRPLVLGGVLFDGERGLEGHSDADTVAHACCDAILGIAGLGDIGSLFPDDDERWRGADSLVLLAEAAERVRRTGRQIGNIDCSVVAERPRLAPRRAEMQARLSEAAGAPVTVRGKRAESLGALGRGEGIACWAVATLF